MPQKNAIKNFAPDSYYHIYARGSSKQPVFLESADYSYFRHLLERYLGSEKQISKTGQLYPNYRESVKLLAYCQMRNHFHFLAYQADINGIQLFMRSLMTSYSRYFNLKYKRSGAVFESRYKGKLIDNDSYLLHISRYIHLNPRGWRTYTHSSLKSYLTGNHPVWLQPHQISDLFLDTREYEVFIEDYEQAKEMWDEIKHSLADQ